MPTERQRRLGAELRKLRQAANMTTEFAAGLLGVPRTNIPNMESGRAGISAARVRTLASNYGCADQRLIDALADMASERETGWWASFRGTVPEAFQDIAEMEWHAVRLRTALTVHLPGLLQIEEHARALVSEVIPPLPAADAEARVAHRMARAKVLQGDDPPTLDAILHEAALRMEFGGSATTRKQLLHILEMSERDHVTVRVIPFKAGGFPGSGQSVIYAEGPVAQLDTVQLDSTHAPEFVHAELQLGKYRAQFRQLDQVALPPSESRDLIRHIADHL